MKKDQLQGRRRTEIQKLDRTNQYKSGFVANINNNYSSSWKEVMSGEKIEVSSTEVNKNIGVGSREQGEEGRCSSKASCHVTHVCSMFGKEKRHTAPNRWLAGNSQIEKNYKRPNRQTIIQRMYGWDQNNYKLLITLTCSDLAPQKLLRLIR